MSGYDTEVKATVFRLKGYIDALCEGPVTFNGGMKGIPLGEKQYYEALYDWGLADRVLLNGKEVTFSANTKTRETKEAMDRILGNSAGFQSDSEKMEEKLQNRGYL